MSSTRMTTLGLSMAMLGLLANLALAIPPVVRQGTVSAIDGHGQATLQLEDGTTLTVQERGWQKDWQVGNPVQCTTQQYPGQQQYQGRQFETTIWNTDCEKS
jgi:hypothetical protein